MKQKRTGVKRHSGLRKTAKLFFAVLFLMLLTGFSLLMAVYIMQPPNRATDEILYQDSFTTAEQDRAVKLQGEMMELPGYTQPAEEEITAQEPVVYEGRYGELLADEEKMKAENVYAKGAKDTEQIVLTFGGDILFDDNYAIMSTYRKSNSIESCLSEELLSEMRSSDICMLNNEFTYTLRGEPTPGKAYTFRARPEYAGILGEMGVDIVSLANNHAYDYGEVSILDTFSALEQENVPYVGAGRNRQEAQRPVYFVINDMKIAYLSATQIERTDNPDTKEATESSPGVNRCWDPENMVESIRQAKENSDFVVVYVHWGSENTEEIDWAQKEQARKFAEAGADLIIGDHPHCLQGIQLIGNTPVIYSVGNFWFNSRPLDTCLIKVIIDENGIRQFQFLPARQENCRTKLLSGSEKQRVIDYMKTLSPGISMDNEGFIALEVKE